MPTLLEFAGGIEAIHRLEDTFYASVLRDPVLQPLFGAPRAEHVEHLTRSLLSPLVGRTCSPESSASRI